MPKFLGLHIEVIDSLECWRGGDHRVLVHDARVDMLHQAINPDERFVICGRCAKAISLRLGELKPVGRSDEASDFGSDQTGSIPVPASIFTDVR